MTEIYHFIVHREWIGLELTEHEWAYEPTMTLEIQSHLVGLSLLYAVVFINETYFQRSRKVIQDGVQKAGPWSDMDRSSNYPP
jgi:hypothetical protein